MGNREGLFSDSFGVPGSKKLHEMSNNQERRVCCNSLISCLDRSLVLILIVGGRGPSEPQFVHVDSVMTAVIVCVSVSWTP